MRIAEEHTFETSDGVHLFYRHWPAPPDRAIVMFHRGHEHSARLQHLVDELDLPDVAMFAWDARGHGRSPGARGDSPSLTRSIKDADEFARHIRDRHGIAIENMAILGQSVGSVQVAAWVHDYAPKIRCMVLASPAFDVKLYIPLARLGISIFHALFGNFFVQSYVKARYLTHDPERIASFQSDPLITRAISARILLDLYSVSERIVADAQAIHTPAQLLISGADWVVRHQPQFDFFDRLGSAFKEKHVFEGFYHDTLGEQQRALPIREARRFIQERFSQPPASTCLLEADRKGYTCDEFNKLSRPLPALSPSRVLFGATKLVLRTGGRLSSGIRLGLASGFDSGSSLDCIYRNTPAGITPLGKLIDWFYLQAIGWRGIRVRRANLEQMLARAVRRLRASGAQVHIADIAAGHGRYVLEGLRSQGLDADRIVLRDFSQENVEQGRRLIDSQGMSGCASFETGDAFNRESVAAILPRPTVGIVSGLYELFPGNAPVRESLSGLAEAIEPGGYLIYTGQPWHPQLEFIARVLPSHRGKAWIMRRRTQAEIDQLVEQAGFTKVDQLIDEWGIFTVSLAQRNGF